MGAQETSRFVQQKYAKIIGVEGVADDLNRPFDQAIHVRGFGSGGGNGVQNSQLFELSSQGSLALFAFGNDLAGDELTDIIFLYPNVWWNAMKPDKIVIWIPPEKYER